MLKTLFFLFLCGAQAQAYVLYSAPVVSTGTTTSTKILNQNTKRAYLLVINRGTTNTAIVKFGSAQSGTEGIPIPPGGSYEPVEAPASSMYLVTDAATTAVTTIEGNQ